MATLYKPSGEAVEVHPEKGDTFEPKALRGFIGCDALQIVFGENAFVLDEKGKLKDLPFNAKPTIIAYKQEALDPDDYFNGDVLVCTRKEVEG